MPKKGHSLGGYHRNHWAGIAEISIPNGGGIMVSANGEIITGKWIDGIYLKENN
jgi:hypothetical protein